MLELIVFGASVAMFSNPLYQCGGIIVILITKLVTMWGYIKVIELAKFIAMLCFFVVLAMGNFFTNKIKIILEFVLIVLMVAVGVI